MNLGPVVHKLVLVLALEKRTVALICSEGVSKIKVRQSSCRDVKIWHSCGVQGIYVQSGDTSVLCRCGTHATWSCLDMVAHISEAEVGEQGWTERIVKTTSEALVSNIGGSGELSARIGWKCGTAGNLSEEARSGAKELLVAVTSKHLRF